MSSTVNSGHARDPGTDCGDTAARVLLQGYGHDKTNSVDADLPAGRQSAAGGPGYRLLG